MRTRTLVVIIAGLFFCGLYIYANVVAPPKSKIDLQTRDKNNQ